MPQILITIDTEIGELGKYRPDAFETFVEGKVDGREVGYKLIMDMLDRYQAKGEFFVDIYPYKQLGEDKFANLCEDIAERGHNVQLHTHPSTAFDEERIYMHQYSLGEQVEILQLGKERIKKWTGKYPMVHRAGGYGINEDTFRALEQAGIHYDSSYFYENANCHFQCNTKNKPFKVGSITEVPVTVFEESAYYEFLGIKLLCRKHFQKLDVRFGATADEIKEVISNSGKDDVIMLFLHSFNFLHLPYNFRKGEYGRISINEDIIKNVDRLLNWISLQANCDFTTVDMLRMDSSHDDVPIGIPRRGNIKQEMLDAFVSKILKVRRT